MKINVTQLVPDSVLPTLGTPGAGCFDVYSTNTHPVCIAPGSGQVFGTGLAFEIPVGHVLLVFSRSGHGFKSGVRLANCVGVLDSDYRGELKVKLTADSAAYTVVPFERIAQIMVLPVPSISFELVDRLSETERGEGGFGSSGK